MSVSSVGRPAVSAPVGVRARPRSPRGAGGRCRCASWSTSAASATVSSQARGWSGTPVGRPLQRRGEQRLLHGVLAGVELPVPADQRAEDLRRELAQQVLDRASRAASLLRGGSSMIRRTSIG